MISVCIATYNGGPYIRQQIASILPQLGDADEVVISDDQSTDDTLQQIQSFGDPRIRIVSHQPAKAKFNVDRSTHNFANAIRCAKGDVIFLADQDDVWLPGKVAKVSQDLADSDLVMTDCSIADEHLNILKPSYAAERPFRLGLWQNFLKSSFLGSCMAFRRQVFESAQPFPRYGVAHDLWLGMVAMKRFRVAYVPEPLMLYRRHSRTVTTSGTSATRSLLFKIRYRLYIARALLRLTKNG